MEIFGNIRKLNHRDAIKHENVFDLKSAGNNTEAQEFLGRGGQVCSLRRFFRFGLGWGVIGIIETQILFSLPYY